MTFIQRLARGALLLLAFAAVFPAQAQAPRTPPVMRLGDAVKPLAYDLALTVDPAHAGFSGRVEIDVDVRQATDFFWMNANRVDVRSAVLTAGGQRYDAKATLAPGDQFAGMQFARAVPAGRAKLAIEFAGRFSTNETRGVFKQQDQGEWYAFTQFESTNARRVFPCFDEPHWKTPWAVTLTVRREHVAVANAPMLSEREVEGGMKQVRFATTQPLPTYLVAFGVGPFDVVDGGVAGTKKTPLRYIVPKGRGADVKYPVQSTPRLLELLEAYFGGPYPYDKLDSLAIPVTVSFGAMENPGLITYRMGLLVSKEGLRDERYQQAYAGVAAHEIAHQWFGDLVTPAWWDDIWLNESFATWMASKIAQQFNPAWEPFQWRERQRMSAFNTDRLSSSRQIRQPVHTRDDLANAFDRITYEKGGAVLNMFEARLGETAFRDGVRRYLKRHEWGNATAEDFFKALGEADPALVPAFTSFIVQPGLPMVDFHLDCTGPQPAVVLRQARFLPASQAPSEQSWTIPACVRVEGVDKPVCTTLRERQQRVALPEAKHCPAWLLPNPAGTGYFLSRLDAPLAKALGSVPLSEQEAIALLAEQSILVTSAAQPVQRLLEVAAPLARDARPEVATAAANAIWELNPAAFNEGTRRDIAAWVRANFGARAAQLGWVPNDNDTDAVRKMRGAIVPLVARIGGDPALRAQARKLAIDWLAGDRRTLAGGFRAVLRTAAQDADAALFDTFVATAQRSTESTVRFEIYKVMGGIKDAALLRRAFDYALSDKADVREAMEIYETAGDDADNAPAVLAYFRERWDLLAARMPEEARGRLPRRHMHLCSAPERDSVAQFYTGPRAAVPGLQRNLAQALETIDICVKARALNAPG
ncbi:M1 family metallopeptidase [Ramlibacter albus]|uniref:Aminopeptidase n=1 Tax=Ramlibacter albus TaxID=2079448 RepID=A0A923MA11_9BURK|nr:M1 family metallopeptidase [Ramlibacter albus]MBC5765504.1 ERAP1-like C-terminal domain-containing protein [Ramlibacter albus]